MAIREYQKERKIMFLVWTPPSGATGTRSSSTRCGFLTGFCDPGNRPGRPLNRTGFPVFIIAIETPFIGLKTCNSTPTDNISTQETIQATNYC